MSETSLRDRVENAVSAIRERWPESGAEPPQVGIILGTGLGSVAKEIVSQATIHYSEIPFFPESTVESHAGKLVCGTLSGIPIVAMEGRFHFYEGYTLDQITFPVRVMRALGAKTLFVSNAAGGMNPFHHPGDIVVIEDHINLMAGNPLTGPNDETLGQRFPDMCAPYDAELIEAALEVARRENFAAHRGVYVGVTGPNLETRAEYRFMRMIGGDVVGMSTIPEVLVAVHAGMRVLGLSVITDQCLPDSLKPTKIEEILATASAAEPKLLAIILGVLKSIPSKSITS